MKQSRAKVTAECLMSVETRVFPINW